MRPQGGEASLSSLQGDQGTVIIFWSNQCRWTEGYEARVSALHSAASAQGMRLVLVNSNDANAFPEESVAASAAKGYAMTYVHDVGGNLASTLGAYRAPEVFVFDGSGMLVYTGGIDDAPADESAVTERYIADVMNGNIPAPTKAFGCRIRLPGG